MRELVRAIFLEAFFRATTSKQSVVESRKARAHFLRTLGPTLRQSDGWLFYPPPETEFEWPGEEE